MQVEIVEVDDLDPEDVPLCPLCDQPIMASEAVSIVNCQQTLALVHEDCAEEE